MSVVVVGIGNNIKKREIKREGRKGGRKGTGGVRKKQYSKESYPNQIHRWPTGPRQNCY